MKTPNFKVPKFKAQPVVAFHPSGSGIPRGTRGVPQAVKMEGRKDRALFAGLNHTSVRNPSGHMAKLLNS